MSGWIQVWRGDRWEREGGEADGLVGVRPRGAYG